MRKFSWILLTCLFSVLLITSNAGIVHAQVSSTPELTAEFTTTTPTLPTRTSGPTPTPGETVQVSTPAGDGSITHVVRAGETLITIAEAYEVSLSDLYELNGMNQDSVIYPGEELVIRAGSTATPTSPPTRTPTPTNIPTLTRRPTRTPLPPEEAGTGSGAGVAQFTPELTPTQVPAEREPDRVGNILLAAIAVLGVGGVVLILLGSVLRRNA